MFGMNEIWLLLGIPMIATIYLMIFHRKATVWWEFLIIWVVAVGMIAGGQFFAERTTISDDEVWGFNAVRAEYNEPFRYWDTCSRTYPCGSYT